MANLARRSNGASILGTTQVTHRGRLSDTGQVIAPARSTLLQNLQNLPPGCNDLASRLSQLPHSPLQEEEPFFFPELAMKLQSSLKATCEAARSVSVDGCKESLLSLDWVDGGVFASLILACIITNMFVLWGETDYPEFWAWGLIDNSLLAIFFIEMVLKMCHRGVGHYFISKERWWNMLDFTIVFLGIVALLISALMEGSTEAQNHQNRAVLMRSLRMLRMLRLTRLFKTVDWLNQFMSALMGMVGPVSFFLMMLFNATLIIAIILTQMVKNVEDDELRDKLQVNFHSVTSTFFALFQVTTTDNWILVADPMIELDSRWKIFFIVFIAFASWTMTSILTAVACDRMIEVMADKERKLAEELAAKQKEFIRLLRKAFIESDDDGNGVLDKEEFESFLDSPDLKMVFEIVDVYVSKDEMRKRFEMLDVSGCGELTIDEFVDGLATYQEGLATKHIANLDYATRRLNAHFDSQLSTVETKVQKLKSRNVILMDGIRKQEQIYRQQHCAMFAWQQWAMRTDPKAFPPEFLKEVNNMPTSLATTGTSSVVRTTCAT